MCSLHDFSYTKVTLSFSVKEYFQSNKKSRITMFSFIKRFFRQFHEFLLDNHPTIAVIGSLTIFSYLIYHLPAHIRTSEFKTLDEVLLKITERFGRGSVEAICALMGLIITCVTFFFYLPFTVYHDVQDLFGFRQRRKYLDTKFTKLMSECQEVQKLFGNEENRSLDNLHNINEFLIQSMDKFRTDTNRIVTPTLEEFLSDPRDFFHVDEDLESLV